MLRPDTDEGWRAQEHDVVARVDEVELAQVGDDAAAHRALMVEVEVLQRLVRREAGGLDAAWPP